MRGGGEGVGGGARGIHARKLSRLHTAALGSIRRSALIIPGGIGWPFCAGRGGGRGRLTRSSSTPQSLPTVPSIFRGG